MQDHTDPIKGIADAVTNLTEYSFQMGDTAISVIGEKHSDLFHASIEIDGKPWQGISCGDANNLAGYTLKHIGKELDNRKQG